jgi:hypothetical protein
VGVGWLGEGGGHGEEGIGQHDQDGPMIPGAPAVELVLIEPGLAFGGLKRFLNDPASPGHPDQLAQADQKA